MQLQQNQMQPLTTKEFDYLIDCMSNEDLMMKQIATTSGSTSSTSVQNLCQQLLISHQQNFQSLLNTLQQHQQLAPTQPQS